MFVDLCLESVCPLSRPDPPALTQHMLCRFLPAWRLCPFLSVQVVRLTKNSTVSSSVSWVSPFLIFPLPHFFLIMNLDDLVPSTPSFQITLAHIKVNKVCVCVFMQDLQVHMSLQLRLWVFWWNRFVLWKQTNTESDMRNMDANVVIKYTLAMSIILLHQPRNITFSAKKFYIQHVHLSTHLQLRKVHIRPM